MAHLLLLMEEIRGSPSWDVKRPMVNNGMNYQPQLVNAGFRLPSIRFLGTSEAFGSNQGHWEIWKLTRRATKTLQLLLVISMYIYIYILYIHIYYIDTVHTLVNVIMNLVTFLLWILIPITWGYPPRTNREIIISSFLCYWPLINLHCWWAGDTPNIIVTSTRVEAVLLVWMVACGEKRSTSSKGILGLQRFSSIGPHGKVGSEEEKFLTLEVIKFYEPLNDPL